ncbi:MAG: LuxR C-terminal-related transcriptional regulator [Eubacterium sp.]|nr:LuxR C-terminal-related transcriptional regulator [Eubacterium sp.]
MPKDLLNEEEITLEKLREQFQNNDFTKTDIKPYSEYTTEEVELHNKIRSYIHESWGETLKDFGIKNPNFCFSKDYSPKMIQEYLEKLIADIIITIKHDKVTFKNVWKTFVVPILKQKKGDKLADEYLNNTVRALMETVNIKAITEISNEYSDDRDFNDSNIVNYPKMDHDKKWNHTRSKIKTESLDEMLENDEDDIAEQNFDTESIAVTNVMLKEIIEKADEQEKQIIKMLSEGHTQAEIAKKLGVSQGTVSKKIGKIRKAYKSIE